MVTVGLGRHELPTSPLSVADGGLAPLPSLIALPIAAAITLESLPESSARAFRMFLIYQLESVGGVFAGLAHSQ